MAGGFRFAFDDCTASLVGLACVENQLCTTSGFIEDCIARSDQWPQPAVRNIQGPGIPTLLRRAGRLVDGCSVPVQARIRGAFARNGHALLRHWHRRSAPWFNIARRGEPLLVNAVPVRAHRLRTR